MAQAYDVYHDQPGTARRAVIVVDKEGTVRWVRVYDTGLPDPEEVLAEVDKL